MTMRDTQSGKLGTIVASVLLSWILLGATARAETPRTGDEPWYHQSATSIERAKTLFAQAIDKHQRLLRGEARDLYVQALELWDNPDIRWNLALVLEDLGQYLQAHRQLERAYRWGDALGSERALEIRDRMTALETRHLARIEASCAEPETIITLDGQPWFQGAGKQSVLVEPGEHYLAAHKVGFYPVTRSIAILADHVARVLLPMYADYMIETRRWSAWKPWATVSTGLGVAVAGLVLEREAILSRDNAAKSLQHCTKKCNPDETPGSYKRAVTENRVAIGSLIAGGTATVVGFALVWFNQLKIHRSEARGIGPIEISPALSTNGVGVFAQRQF